ncbi:MAG: glycosyltransferase family 4 protein [Anaerolineales bacterium]
MIDTKRTRLLYLLPRYDTDSSEHFFYLYDFLKKLQTRIPLEVVVERTSGTLPSDLPMRPLHLRFPIFRLTEEIFVFLAARLRGIRDFYVHYSYTGAIAAAIVVRLFGGRAFYWNCSLYREFPLSKDATWEERLRQAVNLWLLETSVRWCTYLVTGTPRVAEYYVKHARIPAQKIRLLPNFVELERFQGISRAEARKKLNLDPNRKVVLFLHRVARRKGAYYLPDIASMVLRKVKPVTFLVAGGGPYLEELRRRMEQQPLAGAFDFRGWIPNRDAPLYFRAADLYLMPSEEEGFPRVLLEAMAADCPFIAFDIGGVRDIVAPDQEACVIPAGDVAAFAAACSDVLLDTARLDAWRKAGARQVERFSEERVLEAFGHMLDGQPLDWRGFLSGGRT